MQLEQCVTEAVVFEESRISGCRDSRERRNGGEMEKAREWHVGTGVQHA